MVIRLRILDRAQNEGMEELTLQARGRYNDEGGTTAFTGGNDDRSIRERDIEPLDDGRGRRAHQV